MGYLYNNFIIIPIPELQNASRCSGLMKMEFDSDRAGECRFYLIYIVSLAHAPHRHYFSWTTRFSSDQEQKQQCPQPQHQPQRHPILPEEWSRTTMTMTMTITIIRLNNEIRRSHPDFFPSQILSQISQCSCMLMRASPL